MAAGSFGDLVIGLRADATGFAADLKKSERTLGGFVKSSVSNLANIGLAVNTLKMGFNALIGPMQEAQEAALAERKLAQVFKSTGNAARVSKDEIMDYAAERQKLTSFDADDTVNAAAILGSFTNIKGNMFTEALTSAQDLSAFMGQDLQTSVIQIGKALNDPAKGVSALAKAGIQFSNSQKEQIKHLQETGQLAKAQSIIFKELQTQFGGQAKALVDPIAQAQNAWGDFMETVGGIAAEKLLPVIPKLIEGFKKLSDMAVGAIDAVEKLNSKLNTKGNQLSGWEKANLAFQGLMTGQSPEDMAQSLKEMRGIGVKQSAKAPMKPTAPKSALPDWVTINPKKGPQTLDEMFKKEQDDLFAMKAGKMKNQSGQFMAGLVRQGLAGLESGLMSLGPAPKEAGERNQIGSLEKGSQEAFDVLRANTSGGNKDVAQKQLKAAEKSNENLAKILKVLNDPKSTRKDVNVVLRGID